MGNCFSGDFKIGIMQPYFLPYIGYWQLMNYVDTFVVYDQIQYTKKGWINRNRYLKDGHPDYFTIPLKKDSDYKDIIDRYLSPNFVREKLLNKLRTVYRKAPYYSETEALLNDIILYHEDNLFWYIFHSINCIAEHLGLDTKIVISSNIKTPAIPLAKEDRGGQNRVLAINKALNASAYINPIGGMDLYDNGAFAGMGIELFFLKANDIKYKQFYKEEHAFVPSLSILDVLMFNGVFKTKGFLKEFTLLTKEDNHVALD